MTPLIRRAVPVLALIAWLVQPAAAQPPDEDPDLEVNFSQPDFTINTLPTNLRVPLGKFAFRVTHRFARPLGDGDLGNLLEDFFGFDSGAQIGLELRYGLIRGGQIGINRTSNRTIQLFAQYDLRSQQSFPIGVGVWGSVDGTNNLRDSYSPAIGVVLSRELGESGAVYAEPIWVNNTSPDPSELVDDNSTFMVGLGARLRVLRTVYLTGEITPRVAGFAPGDALLSFGIEKRAGGHSFQLNFSNGFGTTMAQIGVGYRDAFFVLFGGLAGALAYGYFDAPITAFFAEKGDKVGFDRLLGLPFWMAAIGLAAILVVVLYALESLQSWRNETGTDHDGLMAPPAVTQWSRNWQSNAEGDCPPPCSHCDHNTKAMQCSRSPCPWFLLPAPLQPFYCSQDLRQHSITDPGMQRHHRWRRVLTRRRSG